MMLALKGEALDIAAYCPVCWWARVLTVVCLFYVARSMRVAGLR